MVILKIDVQDRKAATRHANWRQSASGVFRLAFGDDTSSGIAAVLL
jgi:hypothetical protein